MVKLDPDPFWSLLVWSEEVCPEDYVVSWLDHIGAAEREIGVVDAVAHSTSGVKFRWARSVLTRNNVVLLYTSFVQFPIVLEWSDRQVFESVVQAVPCGIHRCVLGVDSTFYPLEDFKVSTFRFEINLEITEDLDLYRPLSVKIYPELFDFGDEVSLSTISDDLDLGATALTFQSDLGRPGDLQIRGEGQGQRYNYQKMDTGLYMDSHINAEMQQNRDWAMNTKTGQPNGHYNGQHDSYDDFKRLGHGFEGHTSTSRFHGDKFEDIETVSEKSDQSQKSIGEKHREALAEMFERKIQRLKNDDLRQHEIPVGVKTSQRNNLKVSDEFKRNEKHPYSTYRGREMTKSNLNRHTMSQERLNVISGGSTCGLNTGITSSFRSGSNDTLNLSHLNSVTRFCSPTRLNKSQDDDARKSSERTQNVYPDIKPDNYGYGTIPVAGYQTKPYTNNYENDYLNYDAATINRYQVNRVNKSPLNRSSDSLPPRSRSLKEHNYKGENGNGSMDKSDDNVKYSKQFEERISPSSNGGLCKRIPGEGSSNAGNQTHSAICKEDIYRIQDMEDTILSLRRLLNDREREIDELKISQQDLQSQLNQQRTTGSSDEIYKNTQQDKRVKELIMEKECLTTELHRMQQEMGRQRNLAAALPQEGDKPFSHIDNYQPNNPLALQRKIQDLESQIEDLTEVNEAALTRYDLLEQQHKKAMEEHSSFSSPSLNLLQQQNKELQQQVMELRKLRSTMGKPGTMEDSDYMQSEVANLRTDLRTLRDKNHQLTQDNIRLTEYIRDLEIGRPPPSDGHEGFSLQEQNDGAMDKFQQERDAALREITFHKEKLQKLQSEPKEQIPSEHKLSSNPYLTHSRTEKNFDFPEGGAYTHNNYHQRSHPHTLNGRGPVDLREHPMDADNDVTDLIDDVIDDLPLSSISHSPNTQGIYQSYPNKQDHIRTVRRDLRLDSAADLRRDTHYISDATELSDSEARIPRRRDSLNSNSTEFLMNELSHHLQLHTSHGDRELSELCPDPAGVADTTIDLANRTVEIGPFQLTERPVNSKAIVTQQNKHIASSSQNGKDLTALLQGKAPFAPRNPTDINLEDVVKFCRQGGKISRGLVKYIGHLPGKNDVYLGIELEHEIGKHDGTYEGQRYFQCKNNRGVFVAFSKVIMVWGAT